MSLKTILFLGLFVVCTVGALWVPMAGVLGYVGHYCIGPERQWWSSGYRWIRFSFVLAALTALGITLNFKALRFGKQFLRTHEKLILLFLGAVWLAWMVGAPTSYRARYTTVDHPTIKFTKVVLFLMMMSHVVTRRKDLDKLFWAFTLGVLVLGLQAYYEPRRSFISGRLDGVGGPDFAEANMLGAFLGSMLPIVAVQFLRSGLVGKALAAVAGVFSLNAIVLTRSRGALVGLACGIVAALLMAPRRHRAKILAGLLVAVAGGYYLTDPQFRERAGTITASEGSRDVSAESRLDMWEGGWDMVVANPLGVGPGNWYQKIGTYVPKYPGKDAHNAFVRCAGELGVQGFIAYVLVVGSAFWTLRRIQAEAEEFPPEMERDFTYFAFGITVSLAVFVGNAMTMSLTYGEGWWWLLMLPVCLQRVRENARVELRAKEAKAAALEPGRAAPPAPQPERRRRRGRARKEYVKA